MYFPSVKSLLNVKLSESADKPGNVSILELPGDVLIVPQVNRALIVLIPSYYLLPAIFPSVYGCSKMQYLMVVKYFQCPILEVELPDSHECNLCQFSPGRCKACMQGSLFLYKGNS